MKACALILAFIVLGLSFMPCSDVTAAGLSKAAKTEVTKSDNTRDNDHNEACSPFCHCACCAGFSISHSLPTFGTIYIRPVRLFSSYLPDNLISISLPIWQPPKI